MRVVLSHFFNEEYLLPWWLLHHREVFDHGVLIDWSSSDASVEICRELVPEWEIVPSVHDEFAAIMCDFEIMSHEARFPEAWKMVLNTTEFLVAPGLASIEERLVAQGLVAARLPAAIMVDNTPDDPPVASESLVDQKRWGMWEDQVNLARLSIPGGAKSRARIYHRYKIGAYGPGRHLSHLPRQLDVERTDGAVWWYGFSPWCNEFKRRKLQIGQRLPEFDRRHGYSRQHLATEADLEAWWTRLSRLARPVDAGARRRRSVRQRVQGAKRALVRR